jgi:hypothetical protein
MVGGLCFLAGSVMMAFNMFMTIRGPQPAHQNTGRGFGQRLAVAGE